VIAVQTEIKKFLKKPRSQFPDGSLPGFELHLSFLNNLELSVRLTTVVEAIPHSSNSMAGWQGLQSLTCLGEDRQLYHIDIRYAWGSEIFKQNLVDHGWSEATLLHKKIKDEPSRHKLIIYLCEDSTNLDKNQQVESVPDRFAVGKYWQSIHHIYLLLPVEHPFNIPDFEIKTRLAGYSTTRFLTKNQPTIVNAPDSKITSALLLPANSERQGEGGLRTKRLWKQSSPKQPLISVITVVFNGAKYIEQTIQSVINQLYDNVEYIIIDGGSNDETLDVIKKYENEIDYWLSEPDQGISDAFNKGVSLSNGILIHILNSDDFYFGRSTVSDMVTEYKSSPQPFYFASCFHVVGKAVFLIRGDANYAEKIKYYMPHVNHPTVFIENKILKLFGFSTKYKNCMDYHLFYRLTLNNIKGKIVEKPLTFFRAGGVSSVFYYKTRKEVLAASIELGSNKFIVFCFYLSFLIKYQINKCIKF